MPEFRFAWSGLLSDFRNLGIFASEEEDARPIARELHG